MAIRLDMEKAYAIIEWDFVEKMLTQFNFYDKWINWVMTIISSTDFYVLVNDTPGKTFTPTRGLCQGDLLAPYIFVLVMKYLTRTLQQQSEKPKIGIKLTPLPRIQERSG